MSKRLIAYLKNVIRSTAGKEMIKSEFLRRVEEGDLTREENPQTHFCIYFAAYDPKHQQVFIGHHKKSDLWLFNGGHIDKGELPLETLKREVKEEWGENIQLEGNYSPAFLTITKIENPVKQICRLHYDIWYFIPFNKKSFRPDKSLLRKEFFQIGWKQIKEAKELVKDSNTIIATAKIEKLFLYVKKGINIENA